MTEVIQSEVKRCHVSTTRPHDWIWYVIILEIQ